MASSYWRWLFFVFLFLLSTVTFYKFITVSVDVPIYFGAARDLSEGNIHLYEKVRQGEDIRYTAGPVAAISWIPFLGWGTEAMKWFWGILNVFLFGALWVITEKFWLAQRQSDPLGPDAICWAQRTITLLMLVDSVSMNGIQGNWTVLLLLLCVSAPYLESRGRPFLGGLISSLAFAIKPPFGFPLLYLLARRSWRGCLGWISGAALFLYGVPGLVLGWDNALGVNQLWVDSLLAGAGNPICKFNNQSPLCIGSELFGKGSAVTRLFVFVFIAAYVGIFLRFAVGGRPFLTWTASVMLLLTASSLVHDHYYVASFFALFYVNGLLFSERLSSFEKWLWGIRMVFVHFLVMGTVGRHAHVWLLAHGQLLWGTVLATVILLSWDLRGRKRNGVWVLVPQPA